MLVEYTRAEAKGWARETFRGACNVIIPSFTSDLRSLNEPAIRHDVRRNMELGFWGALLVSEAGTTQDEMRTRPSARPRDDEITLFKSVGTGAQDLIVASHLLDLAAAAGVGTVVADVNSIKPVA